MSHRNQFNSQEALNIQLGQAGSAIFTTHNAEVQYAGTVYIAITFLEASVFESGVTGLVPETNYL